MVLQAEALWVVWKGEHVAVGEVEIQEAVEKVKHRCLRSSRGNRNAWHQIESTRAGFSSALAKIHM